MKIAHTDRLKRLVPFVLLLGVSLFCGCVTDKERRERTNAMMGSWTGLHQSELIGKWGPPDRTASDGQGGSILIYEKFGQIPGQINRELFGGESYTAPQRVTTSSRMFYVNPEGVIYRWRWQGL